MQLDHEFTVPVGVDEAWRVLLDIERIAPCLPGATITSVDGAEFTGTVKVKVGPITVTYSGAGRFLSTDAEKHVAVIEANGKETRGVGTARATITATMYDDGGTRSRVVASTDLAITGRPAQFGRGVLADVSAKLVGQFADCLAAELGRPPAEAAGQSGQAAEQPGETAAQPGETALATGSAAPSRPARVAEPINLVDAAGVPVLKRLAPLVAAAAVVGLLLNWRRRCRK